jgi:hypothetical protein
MQLRERVAAALHSERPDRMPRFDVWIDGPPEEMGQDYPAGAYVNVG